MAETTKQEKASEPTKTTAPADPPAEKFAASRLIAEAQDFLGCTSHVATGALHGQGDEFTLAEAKARVRTWLATPAKVERRGN